MEFCYIIRAKKITIPPLHGKYRMNFQGVGSKIVVFNESQLMQLMQLTTKTQAVEYHIFR